MMDATKTFDAYEVIGVITPGAVVTLLMALQWPDFRTFLGQEGLSVGGLGIFVIMAFVLGHLTQALGNFIDGMVCPACPRHGCVRRNNRSSRRTNANSSRPKSRPWSRPSQTSVRLIADAGSTFPGACTGAFTQPAGPDGLTPAIEPTACRADWLPPSSAPPLGLHSRPEGSRPRWASPSRWRCWPARACGVQACIMAARCWSPT